MCLGKINLSFRESQVLKLIVIGFNNKEIGKALNISESTVKIHVANILNKMNVKNRITAAVKAVKSGLV